MNIGVKCTVAFEDRIIIGEYLFYDHAGLMEQI
jgi:hypothetical protein